MPSVTGSVNIRAGGAPRRDGSGDDGGSDGRGDADLVPYQYVVLRCVPRVEREEFVNVGVVLFAQTADFLDAAFALDEPRLHAFAPGLSLEQVRVSLETVRAVCRGETGRGLPSLDTPGQRFGWLTASRSTVVQPGPRHGGVCADPGAELVRLVTRLVAATEE